MKYNLILTGGSLLAVIPFAVLYFRACQRLAANRMLVLAGLMLVPNDDCGNYFNRPWIAWLGA